MTDDLAHRLGLRLFPGWVGLHTRDQALGAWANGVRIVKTIMGPGDTHPPGSRGTVLGSMLLPQHGKKRAVLFYFIEWDEHPKFAVAVEARRIGVLNN